MSTRVKRFLMLAVAALFLAASGFLVEPLRYTQVSYDLTNAPVRGVSPGVVLATTALGAFRGIVVDVVWIRMEDLKSEGKYYEIVQLADLACRLAPNFPKVWDFNAWNMAYNVSVKMRDFNDRWLWVKRGIEILRDQGIPNNPNEPELFFNLAIMYLHKVGGSDDDAHFVYKEGMGMEMHEALGGSGAREDLQRFLDAPTTTEGLLQDRGVRQFYEQSVIRGFDPLAELPEEGTLQFFSWVRRPESLPEAVRALWQAEENTNAVEKIAAYARAKRLREQLRLDPKLMIDIVDEYGPLDWRSPFPHVIYWATGGMTAARTYRRHTHERRVKHGLESPDMDDVFLLEKYPEFAYHDINYDRMIYGALQNLVTRGRLVYDSKGRIIPLDNPDYRFTDSMLRHYDKLIEKYRDSRLNIDGIDGAYNNFLRNITVEFFFRGEEKRCRDYFERFNKRYEGGQARFEEFIAKEVKDYLQGMSISQCRTFVTALVLWQYFYLGCGEDEAATEYHNKATKAIAIWHETLPNDRDRTAIKFDDISTLVLTDIFSGKMSFPPEVVERLRQRLPVSVVQRIDESVEEMKKELERLEPMKTSPERRLDKR